ncbi:hypothetical protein Cni_G08749 [Canna indica]|uniref:Wings apart-like protein C-terminal domain-containing protein n=1 Tax=Canna indica TaxID=4628 RepID=A0AAQ3Q5Z7_9LILI|nr:hypothetical protein Cni_G08749 [Canna indica]
MFVRTYARRAARCVGGGGGGRSASDPVLLDSPESDGDSDSAAGELLELPPFSQDASFNSRPAPFSSQDSSSPWSLDPFDLPEDPPPLPPSLFSSSRGGLPLDSLGLDDSGAGRCRVFRDPAAEVTTATLMEAQEFGEMMEHVDEVNFALDGLRPWQPVRVRRASLLSLLSSCETAQQRRLLRVRGMTRRIIEAILDINLDDSPSTVAAAALFYVLASDVQDEHLLDSPSCIGFLLKLLNPKCPDTTGDKLATFGSRLLGKRKPQVIGNSYKGSDSTAKAIISKVLDILLSCKEIKPGSENDEGTERPELNPKWIALLTVEKACLSTLSFEDTCDMVKMPGGEFKEKLRKLGGLDAIFDVLSSCHSTLEAWHFSSSSNLKDEPVLQSMLLLLKCLKIMENATFLSKDNQNHLLGMKQKLNSGGLQLSFVGVIISAIKFFSDFSLLQINLSNSDKGKLISEGQSFQLKAKLTDYSEEPSGSHHSGCSGVNRESEVKVIKICHKRLKSSYSQSKVTLSGSEKAVDFSTSISCHVINRSTGDSCADGVAIKTNLSTIGSRMNSHRNTNKWISIKTNGATTKSEITSKRPLLKDVKKNSEIDIYDPFAFDEGELKPSQWEMLAKKKEKPHAYEGDLAKKELSNGCELPIISTDDVLSQLTNEESQRNFANSHPSGVDEDLSLIEDCLLTSVKVLMNLTNDNPLGCQQIAECDGLHTMASLIINHFPSFDCCFQMNGKLRGSASTSTYDRHRSKRHLNDHELDLLVALLGLLVNLVEKDNRNRLRLADARVSASRPGKSENMEAERDVIPLLCSIFLANQGNGETKEERTLDDEESLLQGAKEAEMMIIEAYAALLLGFLSTESSRIRESIAKCLPNQNLQALVPVLERFVVSYQVSMSSFVSNIPIWKRVNLFLCLLYL